MICKICGADLKDAAFCPMCGAKAGTEVNNEKEKDVTEYCYRNQGMDVDATTVLTSMSVQKVKENNKSGNRDDIKEDTLFQKKEEFRVVVDKPVKKEKKKKKKVIIVIAVISAFLIIVLAVIGYYFLSYKNRIKYNAKTLYYQYQTEICNIDEMKVDYSSYGNLKIIKSDYKNNKYLLKDKEKDQMILASEKNAMEIGTSKNMQQLLYGNQLDKLFYFTAEDTGMSNLYKVEDDEEKEISKKISNLLSGSISENGSYMAYSYCNGEDSYVICEVLPSGEVNQIADLDSSANIVYVSDEGKVFCSVLQKKNNENEKNTYLIYEVQEKKTYGSVFSGLKYFGYYQYLDAYVMEDTDGNLYYVNMKDTGAEKLLASGIGWFMDISEAQEYENSCNREVIVNEQAETTLQTKTPLILYYKDETLYWYDILNSEESKKITENVDELTNLQVWNENQIFYKSNGDLYKTVLQDGKWTRNILVHKNCSEFQYMIATNSLAYLTGNELYIYKNEKQELISDKVESFDINDKTGSLLYSSGSNLVYKKNINAKEKEYHIASEGNVYLIGKMAYYTGLDGEFNKIDLKTLDKTEIVKNPSNITVIWR